MASSSSSSAAGVPPGFRFHPTDEELLLYYLKKKVSFEKFDLEVIRDVDLNKIEPWDLQEKCRIGAAPTNEWYFFSHKDRKYPTGSRTNRATNAGFWKATGRDKCIRTTYKKIGMRKTLVFYRGRAPHGQKTDWIMHEYRLEDSDDPPTSNEDGWVICRVFKKRCFFKPGSTSTDSSSLAIQAMSDDNHCNEPLPLLDSQQHAYNINNMHHHHHFASAPSSFYDLHYHSQPPPPPQQLSYSQFQVQDLLQAHSHHHRPSYDFSVFPSDGSAGTGSTAGDQQNSTEWTATQMIDGIDQGRFSAVAGSSAVLQQMNHQISAASCGKEMELWGYGKQ